MNLFRRGKALKILFVASEAGPFVKVGGLGEVLRSLPQALRDQGHDARVFLPKYATIDDEKFELKQEMSDIHLGDPSTDPYGLLVSNVLRNENEQGQVVAYFLENQEYYEKRANVYGYADDPVRWVLLSKGVLEFLRRSDWVPDILVASDWQTGFVPNLLRKEYASEPRFAKIRTVFTIHNLRFQGMFDPRFIPEMDFDAGQQKLPEFFDPNLSKMNGMRRGIMYADVVSTVSPTYSREILSEEFGEGLGRLLEERRSRLYGILNGIDTDRLNPETDPDIASSYSAKNIEPRGANKAELQRQFGLPQDPSKFVIGIVSRMDEQKGFQLIREVAAPLLANLDFQLIVLGDGDPAYREFFQDLQKDNPQRIAGHYFFDAVLPRKIFAGADVLLMPSRFEPCGLTQMEAMRYGCIPIVHRTGGLADSVSDFRPGEHKGTGFVFDRFDPFSLLIAIVRAYDAFGYGKEWQKLIIRAMQEDFSWHKSAQDYVKMFRLALKEKPSKTE